MERGRGSYSKIVGNMIQNIYGVGKSGGYGQHAEPEAGTRTCSSSRSTDDWKRPQRMGRFIRRKLSPPGAKSRILCNPQIGGDTACDAMLEELVW